jgi:hypothetical protein
MSYKPVALAAGEQTPPRFAVEVPARRRACLRSRLPRRGKPVPL